MPYQNRVDPFGAIHAVPDHGLFTGNRGVIHDPGTRRLLRRRWTTRAWIICDCAFKERRRDVMGRNSPSGGPGWTNLFFMDEVTALAAGHRPCFECRRQSARDFARCLAAGQGVTAMPAPKIDALLHGQRRAAGAPAPRLSREEAEALPDGTMVAIAGGAYALCGGKFMRWSFSGYEPESPVSRQAELLTPPATVTALRAGYRPVWRVTPALGNFRQAP